MRLTSGINADIAHAMKNHEGVTGESVASDERWLELLVETARFWRNLGFFGSDGAFHIHGVTGPDEYTVLVEDNAFTNLVARQNLRYAAESVLRAQERNPDGYARVENRTRLGKEEPQEWRLAARAMALPPRNDKGVMGQDAHFLEREPWDLASTPPDRFPLLLHYHPLTLYRHQVIKQPDLVLALHLLEEEFSEEERRRNFDYYDAITTGDSSLSPPIQCIVGARVGREEKALAHFEEALYMDLVDMAGNTRDGLHLACAGGVWQCLVLGFAGVRQGEGGIEIDPRLPRQWQALEFALQFRARRIRVSITHDELRCQLEAGEPISVKMGDEVRLLEEALTLKV